MAGEKGGEKKFHGYCHDKFLPAESPPSYKLGVHWETPGVESKEVSKILQRLRLKTKSQR